MVGFPVRIFGLVRVGLVFVLVYATTPARPDLGIAGGWIEGPAKVVDGDTIKAAGVTIRLHGIDAPESGQDCNRADGGVWDCGHAATRFLARMIEGREVRCQALTLDKYRRTVARCFLGEADVNAEMVRQGLAWAFVRYASDYAGIEAQARRAKIGIWQAPTQTAWDFRAGKWQSAADQAPQPGCAIKGNVNGQGERIYHMPWSPFYTNVKMEFGKGKGKRWFCSETDAVEAGWRPSKLR